MIFFFDTSAALILQEDMFQFSDGRYPRISTYTFKELEDIKSSNTKSDDIKAKARRLLHTLANRTDYIAIPYNKEDYQEFQESIDASKSPDTKIMAAAFYYQKEIGESLTFVTADLFQCQIAATAHLATQYIEAQPEDAYLGYKTITIKSQEEMEEIFQAIEWNDNSAFELLYNEYLILLDIDGEVIEKYKWVGHFEKIKYAKCNSDHFGELKPRNVHQLLALDSMKNNQITLIGGPAGSGKTMLSLSFLFDQLEHNMIDRIVIFCNPVVAKNAAKLGFYPGTQTEKILSSQVGNVLASKLGSMLEVENLIAKGVLQIIPAGDSRGYEVPAHSGVYIMEAQNLDTVLLRMLLQRIGEDCKVIVDGDRLEQTDLDIYANDNGMKKMSQVFRGEPIFGQVDLKTIERSKIARIAERMK